MNNNAPRLVIHRPSSLSEGKNASIQKEFDPDVDKHRTVRTIEATSGPDVDSASLDRVRLGLEGQQCFIYGLEERASSAAT